MPGRSWAFEVGIMRADADRELSTLPDLLRPGLDLAFVGINPGSFWFRGLRAFLDHRIWERPGARGSGDVAGGPVIR